MKDLQLIVKAVLLLFMMALLPLEIVAQQTAIKGSVKDNRSGEPLVGAHVRVDPGNRGTVTDASGIFELSKLQEGSFTLTVSYVGYRPVKKEIDIREGQTYKLSFVLERGSSGMLEPITVMARRSHATELSSEVDVSSTVNPSHDAGSFLSALPNVSGIRKSGGFGMDPVMRGFSKHQLEVQIDGGVHVQGACPNRMDPPSAHVQIEHVDRVEVMKGPYALRYGPAFGGVINFVTRRPDMSGNFGLQGDFSSSYESNLAGRRLAGGIYGGSRDYYIDLHGSTSLFDDYNDGSGREVQAHVQSSEFSAETGLQLSSNQRLWASYNGSWIRDGEYPALMMDMREDNTHYGSLNYEGHYSSGLIRQVEAKAYYSHVDHIMDNLDRAMAKMAEAVTDVTTEIAGYRLESRFQLQGGLLYVGSDGRFKRVEGNRTRDFKMGDMAGMTVIDNVWQDGRIDNVGLFTEYRTQFSEYSFVASVRGDYNYADAGQPADRFEESVGKLESEFVNLSVSAGLNRSLGSGWEAGFWLGRGARSPGMDERYINYLPIGLDPYEYIGNPQLDPEVNHQADFMLRWDSNIGTMRSSVFYSWITDYISAYIREDLQPQQMGVPGVKQFTNIGDAQLYGFEWTYHSPERYKLGVNLSAAYTIGENLETNEDLPQIPPFEFDATLRYRFMNGRIVPELKWRGVTEQDRVAENFGETTTPGFSVTDFQLTVNPYSRIKLSAGVRNLFDVTYYEHLNRNLQGSRTAIYNPGRSYFIELKWNGFNLLTQ